MTQMANCKDPVVVRRENEASLDADGEEGIVSESAFSSFVAGTAGGLVSSLLTHPLDVVITRMQAQMHSTQAQKYRNTGSELFLIANQEGLRGLFSGVIPGLLGSMTAWGVYFVAYNHLRALLQHRFRDHDERFSKRHLSPVSNVACAVAAGCVSTVATQPIWLIKTRLQLQQRSCSQYKGMMHCSVDIFRTEGVYGLYR